MQYMGQMFDYASAEATCQKTRYRKHVCDDFDRGTGKGATSFYLWQNQPCKLQVQVDPKAIVKVIQPVMELYGPDIHGLLSSMLQPDPKKRPSAAEIVD